MKGLLNYCGVCNIPQSSLNNATLFKIFIFSPKIQLWFPEKIVDFFGWKTRENVVVLVFLAVDNFNFTRKIEVRQITSNKPASEDRAKRDPSYVYLKAKQSKAKRDLFCPILSDFLNMSAFVKLFNLVQFSILSNFIHHFCNFVWFFNF